MNATMPMFAWLHELTVRLMRLAETLGCAGAPRSDRSVRPQASRRAADRRPDSGDDADRWLPWPR